MVFPFWWQQSLLGGREQLLFKIMNAPSVGVTMFYQAWEFSGFFLISGFFRAQKILKSEQIMQSFHIFKQKYSNECPWSWVSGFLWKAYSHACLCCTVIECTIQWRKNHIWLIQFSNMFISASDIMNLNNGSFKCPIDSSNHTCSRFNNRSFRGIVVALIAVIYFNGLVRDC